MQKTIHPCQKGPNKQPCRNIRIGQAYDIAVDCRLCWLFAHDERYRVAWGGDGNVTSAPSAPISQPPAGTPKPRFSERFEIPCIHLGEETGERYDCIACGGQKQQVVLGCALHERCVWKRKLIYRDKHGEVHTVRWCVTCDDYIARAEKKDSA